MLDPWIRDVCLSKGVPASEAETIKGQLFSFGSFRLGVNSEEGDVDVMLLAPKYIDRNDFFAQFPKILKEMQVNITEAITICGDSIWLIT